MAWIESHVLRPFPYVEEENLCKTYKKVQTLKQNKKWEENPKQKVVKKLL